MPTHVEVEDDDDSGRMASGDVEMSGFAPDFFEVRASLLCGRLARVCVSALSHARRITAALLRVRVVV